MILFPSCAKREAEKSPEEVQAEFGEIIFGMFIHFGLYAIPGGIWKSDTMPVGTIAEQIMRHFKIPREEYRQLALEFNPTEFNPEKIVGLAKKAGMKYLVITAKHIDGFAMFHSDYDNYNIKDGTPYGRDLLKELSEECRKQGIKFGIYYSQIRDLDEYHSVDFWGNNWDWDKDDQKRNLQVYLDAKVKPQLKELLTNYGEIFCLWFDVPGIISKQQAKELYAMVKLYQPACLVNSRIGQGYGDYGVMGDNQIPPGVLNWVWECPATMNHTWGYHQLDNTWKPSAHMITQLADLSSKNINYLLNIGPKADGSIPEESVKRLEDIGKWVKKNGEAIYNTGPSPWFHEMDGFRVTTAENVIYITILDPEIEKITLYNLNNKVVKAEVLAGNIPVSFETEKLSKPEVSMLTLTIPGELRNEILPVIKLSIKGNPDVKDIPTQMSSGDILLQTGMAKVNKNEGDLEISGMDGVIDTNNWPYFATRNWTSTKDHLSWDFNLIDPGTFEVQVINVATVRDQASYRRKWKEVYKSPEDYSKVKLTVGDKEVSGDLQGQEAVNSIRSAYRPEFANRIGTIKIDQPGTYYAALRADFINPLDKEGLVIYEVRLIKVN